jgi:hypothetical protein
MIDELDADDPEGDGGRVLLGSAAGVNSLGELEVELAGGWPSDRNFPRMLAASLEEMVVVVVVLRGLANTVTVTVAGSFLSLGLPVLKFEDEDEDDLEEVLEDVVLGLVELSEPVMPPLLTEAFIRPMAVLSLVQSRDVPEARISGMAKHC